MTHRRNQAVPRLDAERVLGGATGGAGVGRTGTSLTAGPAGGTGAGSGVACTPPLVRMRFGEGVEGPSLSPSADVFARFLPLKRRVGVEGALVLPDAAFARAGTKQFGKVGEVLDNEDRLATLMTFVPGTDRC